LDILLHKRLCLLSRCMFLRLLNLHFLTLKQSLEPGWPH